MASYPDCEVCGDDAGRHTIIKNGDKLQVCTGCMLEELGEAL